MPLTASETVALEEENVCRHFDTYLEASMPDRSLSPCTDSPKAELSEKEAMETSSLEAETPAVSILLIFKRGGEHSLGTGVELLLPAQCHSLRLWTLLSRYGALALGQSDRHKLLFEMGFPDFPHDYPESLAGDLYNRSLALETFQRYNRTPPSKRCNYPLNGIPFPFYPNFFALSEHTAMSRHFSVLRLNSSSIFSTLHQLPPPLSEGRATLTHATLFRSLSLFCNHVISLMNTAAGSLSSSMAWNLGEWKTVHLPVRIVVDSEGVPRRLCHIFKPSNEDMVEFFLRKKISHPKQQPKSSACHKRMLTSASGFPMERLHTSYRQKNLKKCDLKRIHDQFPPLKETPSPLASSHALEDLSLTERFNDAVNTQNYFMTHSSSTSKNIQKKNQQISHALPSLQNPLFDEFSSKNVQPAKSSESCVTTLQAMEGPLINPALLCKTLIGFVSSGNHSLLKGTGIGLGHVSVNAFFELLLQQRNYITRSSEHRRAVQTQSIFDTIRLMVWIRNPSERCYHPAWLSLVIEKYS
ncbi:hypothetical protein IE077_002706 [Cardiosporidium cionae]|uniref:Uncharacterized protein n=1 Tax=Cardiosporidium cionae TaxID=476202 RepID=A0ABQ7JA77_9APIC|nr:hypothetical protein IE077_002706 [Cardiosporidium cionae]|eukprot:KAF8820887.1 hypothetical protein IE077_002706 [Cardiosporidium cionae]